MTTPQIAFWTATIGVGIAGSVALFLLGQPVRGKQVVVGLVALAVLSLAGLAFMTAGEVSLMERVWAVLLSALAGMGLNRVVSRLATV